MLKWKTFLIEKNVNFHSKQIKRQIFEYVTNSLLMICWVRIKIPYLRKKIFISSLIYTIEEGSKLAKNWWFIYKSNCLRYRIFLLRKKISKFILALDTLNFLWQVKYCRVYLKIWIFVIHQSVNKCKKISSKFSYIYIYIYIYIYNIADEVKRPVEQWRCISEIDEEDEDH